MFRLEMVVSRWIIKLSLHVRSKYNHIATAITKLFNYLAFTFFATLNQCSLFRQPPYLDQFCRCHGDELNQSEVSNYQCDEIFCTVGNFFKPLATIKLPKSLTFLGNFCKGIKIYHFSSEIIFGQLLQTFGDFYLVALAITQI